MNAAVVSGLLLMAGGALFVYSGAAHASLITVGFGAALLGLGGIAVARWWGR